jgi:hypothetical protein
MCCRIDQNRYPKVQQNIRRNTKLAAKQQEEEQK